MSATLISVVAVGASLITQAGRPEPRMVCPAQSSKVELPLGDGGRVLRCVDDSSGIQVGPEIWLGPNGFFTQRGTWAQGQRHGLWERWYPSGHLASRVTYNQGVVSNATCLTEQKRKEVECTPEWHPMDWQAPTAQPAAQPATEGG